MVTEMSIGVLEKTEMASLLSLQSANLKSIVSAEEAGLQGFLTFQYSPTMVEEMMADMPQPIIRSGSDLVGYALAISQEVSLKNPLLAPAVELTNTLSYRGNLLSSVPYYIMGQICVAKKYRSLGVFDALYASHQQLFSSTFIYTVTEIAVNNKRSLAAHKRVGFEIIESYFDGETDWNIVIWDFK